MLKAFHNILPTNNLCAHKRIHLISAQHAIVTLRTWTIYFSMQPGWSVLEPSLGLH